MFSHLDWVRLQSGPDLTKLMAVACLIYSACQAMVGFFSLIYFYRAGLGLDLIIFYCWLHAGFGFLLNNFVLGRLISGLGPVGLVAVSNLTLVVFCLLVIKLQLSPLFLIGLALVGALAKQGWRLGQRTYLATFDQSQTGGHRAGRLFSLEPLGGIIGLVLGGLTGWLLGGDWIFIVMIGLLLASIPIILWSRHLSHKTTIRFYDIRQFYGYFRQHPGLPLIFCRDQLYMICGSVFWLLYLGIFWPSQSVYGLIGLYSGLASLMAVWVSRWAGRASDRGWPRLPIVDSCLNAAANLVKAASSWMGLAYLGPLFFAESIFGWAGYEVRTVGHYRRAYIESHKFKSRKLAYFLALDTIERIFSWLVLSLALIVSLLITSELTIIRGALLIGALVALVDLAAKLLQPRTPAGGRGLTGPAVAVKSIGIRFCEMTNRSYLFEIDADRSLKR